MYHMSHVMCHASCVMYHMPHVMGHVSHVTCHIIYKYLYFMLDKLVELFGGGSVINKAYPI